MNGLLYFVAGVEKENCYMQYFKGENTFVKNLS